MGFRRGSLRDGGPIAAAALVIHHPHRDAGAVLVGLDRAEREHGAADAVDVAGPVLQRHRSRGGGRRQREPAVEPQGRAAAEPHRRAAVGAGEGRAALLGVADVQRALSRAAVPHLDRLDGRHHRARGGAIDEPPLVGRGGGGAGVRGDGAGADAAVAGLPGRATVVARAAVRDVGLEARTSTDRRGRGHRPGVDRRGRGAGVRGGRGDRGAGVDDGPRARVRLGLGLGHRDEVHVAAESGEDEGESRDERAGGVHLVFDPFPTGAIGGRSIKHWDSENQEVSHLAMAVTDE